jgi:hypothetical protein
MAQVLDLFGRQVGPAQAKPGYRAFEVSDRPEADLFLVFSDQNRYLILRYADLESIGSSPGEDCNRVVMLRFHGSVKRDVRIEGRRLMELVDHLRWHKVPWIEETRKRWTPYGDDNVSVSRITVKEIKH